MVILYHQHYPAFGNLFCAHSAVDFVFLLLARQNTSELDCALARSSVLACEAVEYGFFYFHVGMVGCSCSLVVLRLRSSQKATAAIAVCRRGGATAAFESLNMPFQMMNMPVVTSQYWNIVYGRTPGEAALDREGMQTMQTLARNMAWLLKSTNGEKAPGRPKDEPWDMMHFIR